MEKIEQKMFEAIVSLPEYEQANREAIAQVTAKIALELAQDAYDQGRADQAEYEEGQGNGTFKRFIKNYD